MYNVSVQCCSNAEVSDTTAVDGIANDGNKLFSFNSTTMINRTVPLGQFKGTFQQPNIFGYYGNYGGAYIPEMLHRNVEELKSRYLEIMYDDSFQKEFRALLRDYVGRPTPLYLAERLSKQFNTTIYLKREDLCHTGAHKINNTIGQILLAQRLGKKRIIAETGAGQHGVATATVCALKGMPCIVYMGEKDIERHRMWQG